MAASELNVHPQVAQASAECGSTAAHADDNVSNAAREIVRFTVASHDRSAKRCDMHTHAIPPGRQRNASRKSGEARGSAWRLLTSGPEGRVGLGQELWKLGGGRCNQQ